MQEHPATPWTSLSIVKSDITSTVLKQVMKADGNHLGLQKRFDMYEQ